MIRLFLLFASLFAREIFTGLTETGSAPVGSKCEFPFYFENRTHDDCHFQLGTAWTLLLRGASRTRQLASGAFVFQRRCVLNYLTDEICVFSILVLKTNSEKVESAELPFRKPLLFPTLKRSALHSTASFTTLLFHSPPLRICLKSTFKILFRYF